MKHIPLLLVAALLSSCMVANENTVASLGGKGAYKGKNFGVIWDHENSFRDGAILATAAVGAWANVASTKAAEATTRAVDANRSAEAINASNNAAKIASEGIAADVTKTITVPK